MSKPYGSLGDFPERGPQPQEPREDSSRMWIVMWIALVALFVAWWFK